jgi:hypothetical protein
MNVGPIELDEQEFQKWEKEGQLVQGPDGNQFILLTGVWLLKKRK